MYSSSFVLLILLAASEKINAAGLMSQRSAGGIPANIVDFPYQVSIQYSFYGHVCGGAIISDTWIVTTARCVKNFDPERLSVIVGSTELDNANAAVHEVLQVIVHEGFSGSPLPENDIALLQVDPLNLGPGVQEVALPDQDFDPLVTVDCQFTGWGASKMGGDIPWGLQQLPQTTVPFVACRFAFNVSTSILLPDTTLCATNVPLLAESGPCMGEWGSPLVCRVLSSARPLLLGLMSADPLVCGRAPLPNLYTQVSSFRGWIDQRVTRV